MVSETLVRRWEAVYREYGLASQKVSATEPGDRAVARQMARASNDVAVVWRAMADEPELAWWSVAALRAAAQAFEYQARDWAARAKYDRADSAPSRRSPLPVAQPSGDGPGGGRRERRASEPDGVEAGARGVERGAAVGGRQSKRVVGVLPAERLGVRPGCGD